MRRRRIRTLAILLGAAGLGCARSGGEEPDVRVDWDERFTLGVGASAEVGGDYQVRFARVREDSRCPDGARCVRAGSAAAEFAIESERGTATLTVQTDRPPRSAAAMGGELSLVELVPRPRVGAAPDSLAYRAVLVVRAAP